MQWVRQWFKEDKNQKQKIFPQKLFSFWCKFFLCYLKRSRHFHFPVANGSFKSCFFYCWLTELPEETFSMSGLKSWNWLQSNFLNKWFWNKKKGQLNGFFYLTTVKIMVYLKVCPFLSNSMCLFIHKTSFQRKILNLVLWIVLVSLYLAEIMNNLNGEITACSSSDCYL